MMHVGLLMQGGTQSIGSAGYIRNVAAAFHEARQAHPQLRISLIHSEPLPADLLSQFRVFCDDVIDESKRGPVSSIANRIRWRAGRHGLFGQRNQRFVDFIRELGVTFLYPYGEVDSAGDGFRSAAWIYDFQHVHLPHFFNSEQLASRNRLFKSVAEGASRVVLSSESARHDFVSAFPNASSKARIVQFATMPESKWFTGDADAVCRSYGLPQRFFVVPNQWWQHKNHTLVFSALAILKQRGIAPNIVFTGHMYDGRKPAHLDDMLQLISVNSLRETTWLLGLIPRADQIQILRNCVAIVQPSLFEGWSTVVEDARCLGKPAILSDLDVHVEQHLPGAVIVPRSDAAALADAMEQAWLNPQGINTSVGAANSVSHAVAVARFSQQLMDLASE
jgi:glycosyltransferase involved in cell wall biosynthesis